MKNLFKHFVDLHNQKEPLLIGNVWNVQSAEIFERNGYKAIATSSAAVARTLGYSDGEEISFEEYLFIIERIARRSNIPFSVDLEAGYGETIDEIVDNIKILASNGIAGINIEDSKFHQGKRELVKEEYFRDKLIAICQKLKQEQIEIFINVRIDPFLNGHNNPLKEAIGRIKCYENTGIHGIFLPCITNAKDIQSVIEVTQLPLNVMCMEELPNFQVLNSLGVKRISSGDFLNVAVYKRMDEYLKSIKNKASFEPLFVS